MPLTSACELLFSVLDSLTIHRSRRLAVTGVYDGKILTERSSQIHIVYAFDGVNTEFLRNDLPM